MVVVIVMEVILPSCFPFPSVHVCAWGCTLLIIILISGMCAHCIASSGSKDDRSLVLEILGSKINFYLLPVLCFFLSFSFVQLVNFRFSGNVKILDSGWGEKHRVIQACNNILSVWACRSIFLLSLWKILQCMMGLFYNLHVES